MPQGGKQFVIVIDKEGEGDALKMVSRRAEVQLGVRQGAQVQITAGVNEGDTVVVAGQHRLQRDGTAVRIVDMSRPPGAGKGGPPGAPGVAGPPGVAAGAGPAAGAPAARPEGGPSAGPAAVARPGAAQAPN